MRRVIFNDLEQRLLDIDDTGSVDGTKLLWDEAKDGPISKEALDNLGNLSKVRGALVIDQKKVDAKAAAQAALDVERTARGAVKIRLGQLMGQADMTANDVKESVMKLLNYMSKDLS